MNGRETDHDGDVYIRKYTKHGTCGIWETHGRVREKNRLAAGACCQTGGEVSSKTRPIL